MSFEEVRFPTGIALGARGGPERRTEIVTLGSGREKRNARWAHARRKWDAGWGIKTVGALSEVVTFFEERRGRLNGFRWRDRLDHSSALPGAVVTPFDQTLGTGDGARTQFQLIKAYGTGDDPYLRPIVKPVAGTIRIAVDGAEIADGYAVDTATGAVTFAAPPEEGAQVTAGFQFDVPVRFDTDYLEVDLAAFEAGAIPSVPVIEVRL